MCLSTNNNTIVDHHDQYQQDEEVMTTIHIMRQQEEFYLPEDYLQSMEEDNDDDDDDPFSAFQNKPIDEQWRCRMVEWCYTVSDHFHLNRDTVAITMNTFDRFMSSITSEDALYHDPKSVMYYQLVVMVCLYISVKVHEPMAIEPKTVSLMSKGLYTEEDILNMEQIILNTIQWRFNPPTPMSFVHSFLSIIKMSTGSELIDSSESKTKILELTEQQIELGLTDYLFVGSYASCMALAALSNSIRAIHKSASPSSSSIKKIKLLQSTVSDIITNTNMSSVDLVLYQDCLWNLIKKEPPTGITNHSQIMSQSSNIKSVTSLNDEESSFSSSPRGISSPSFHTTIAQS